MNCHSTRTVLDLHAEGRLTPRRAKSVEAHLASCAACGELARPLVSPAKPAAGGFKTRLAAALKAERRSSPAPLTVAKLELWPRDLSGVAFAAAVLALVSLFIGWSGAPNQRDMNGDGLAIGRMP